MGGSRAPGKNLIAVGRVLIAIAAIFFGVQHFLHPLGLPGVPLEKQMPTWVPARPFIDYLTGIPPGHGDYLLVTRNLSQPSGKQRSTTSRVASAAGRLCCVLGRFSSQEVQVLYPT
jgi:hypothetical protein